jgi:hypothetical protein
LFHFPVSLCGNPVFEGLGLEQHWHPPWLSLDLIMPPKNKASKPPADKVEASKAVVFAAVEMAARDGTATAEPLAPQTMGDNTVPL